MVPRAIYTAISDIAETWLVAKALEAEALHNSTYYSVVLDFNDKNEHYSYFLKVVDVFLCLEDRYYPKWKEGNSAVASYYDIPLDLPDIEDNNNFLPQPNHDFIPVRVRRQASKHIPNLFLWVGVKSIELHPAILEESQNVSVIRLSCRPGL